MKGIKVKKSKKKKKDDNDLKFFLTFFFCFKNFSKFEILQNSSVINFIQTTTNLIFNN